MTFSEIAIRMYPYWIMGILMLVAVYNSKYRYLLRVEKKPLVKWSIFLVVITLWRIFIFTRFNHNTTLHSLTEGAAMIPWQATLTVFWEDACHGLPLAIMSIALGKDRWWKKAITWGMVGLIMASFGLGHVYQGNWAAFFLSFYIPYTFIKGQEIGFGTIMIGHTMYDLSTILAIKTFLG